MSETTAPVPADDTALPFSSNRVDTSSISLDASLDDLIPPELKKLMEDSPSSKEIIKDEEDPPVVTESNQDKDDTPVDISSEAIDRLLKGEPDPVVEPEKPFWHDDEEYIDFSGQLESYGLKKELLDSIVKKVSDKYVVDNSKLLQGLEEKLKESTTKVETLESEQKRLRDMERGLLFDELPEVKTKYGAPMIDAVTDIQTVLEREGASVSVAQILRAKNKSEVLTLIEGAQLPDKDVIRVVEQWRSYKDTELAYSSAKAEAREKGIGAVTSKISEDTIDTVFKNSLSSLIKQDEYSYINKAIREGVDKHQDVGNLIGLGKTNTAAFIKALQNPTEYLHSREWLEGLAKYTLDAAHNKHLASQLPAMQAIIKDQKASLEKVVREYRRLAEAAKGISNGSTPGFVKSNSKQSSKDSSLTPEEVDRFSKGDYEAILKSIPGMG